MSAPAWVSVEMTTYRSIVSQVAIVSSVGVYQDLASSVDPSVGKPSFRSAGQQHGNVGPRLLSRPHADTQARHRDEAVDRSLVVAVNRRNSRGDKCFRVIAALRTQRVTPGGDHHRWRQAGQAGPQRRGVRMTAVRE